MHKSIPTLVVNSPDLDPAGGGGVQRGGVAGEPRPDKVAQPPNEADRTELLREGLGEDGFGCCVGTRRLK